MPDDNAPLYQIFESLGRIEQAVTGQAARVEDHETRLRVLEADRQDGKGQRKGLRLAWEIFRSLPGTVVGLLAGIYGKEAIQ